MIVWLNGTHGVGKTTTSELLQRMLPDSRVLDAEKVGEVLMEPYAEAARTWLHADAEVIDTTNIAPSEAARQIADSVLRTP